jgi:peptidoglycan/xylan/chitin deacetylase (PgdA/CDA1 family)
MRSAGRSATAILALALLAAAPMLTVSGKPVGARHSGARSSASPRLSILVYHAISDHGEDPVLADHSVPPARFAEQLDALQSKGWTFVDLDTALAGLRGERPLPHRALLLTFDDGYVDLLSDACPILEQREIPAVVFAVAGQIGGTNVWDNGNGAQPVPLLDAAGLRKITASGVEIGAHTTSHPALTEVAAEQLGEELEGAADRIEALGLPRPRAFSYPFGLWSERLARAVEEAGYEVAFTVERGVVTPEVDLHALPRTAVCAGDSGMHLHVKLATATWPKFVRNTLRRLAPTRS